MYTYYGFVENVHDGDTLTVDVDLGFYTERKSVKARIAGISCREIAMTGGPECRDHVISLLPLGSKVVIRSVKLEHDPADEMSFDRYVLYVQLPDGRDLGQVLISEGWAVPWNGKTKPTPYPVWPLDTPPPVS